MDELNELDVGPAPSPAAGGRMAEATLAALQKAYDEEEIAAITAMDEKFVNAGEADESGEETAAAAASLLRNGS